MRPHLKFCTQAWSPWTVEDKVLGSTRKSSEKGGGHGLWTGITCVRGEVGLQSLEERRHQADMHMVHKIMHGGGDLDYNTWFEKASDSVRPTRSSTDPLNVKVNNGRLEVRRNFFSVRVAGQWNSVPSHLKQLRSAHHFKKA